MDLPVEFLEKYKKILGEEFAAFHASFDQPVQTAFRVNPLKELDERFRVAKDLLIGPPKSTDGSVSKFEKIPKQHFGYYGKISGKSIEHVTGLIYSQEPAAQVVGEVAAPKKGMRVLDLCAAPGGKSTHLASFLENTGILVSNEISNKRSKILVENSERFGSRNTIVLNEQPERLARVFPAYFDLIVLDAPCSGEGMFRKNPSAIQYWTEDYPAECAELQRVIITEALKMLAPGGHLIYSTCTWAPEENEANIRWILENYPELALQDIPKTNGLQAGLNMPEVVRCWPHRFRGEGQFVAHLVDTGKKLENLKVKSGKSNLTREQVQLWEDFSHRYLLTELSAGILQVFGDQLYLLPAGLPDLSSLKIARNGLHLGVFKKKRFEPSLALGMALKPAEVTTSLEISEEQFQNYVSGATFATDKAVSKGWVQLTVGGNGLGFAKNVNGIIKNYFPKGLRFIS